MPSITDYFYDLFHGAAPADDYYIILGVGGGLVVLCWSACCLYFFLDLGATASNAETLRKMKKRKKKKKKRRQMGYDDGGSDMSGLSDYTEEEALLGTDGEPVTDEALLRTFRQVLASGVNILQHCIKGPVAQIHLTLNRDIISWSGGRSVNGSRELRVSDIMFVDIGKRTVAFVSGMSSQNVNEDCCFSLVTSNQSLDLQASSKMEREAMAQGFSMLMAAHAAAANV